MAKVERTAKDCFAVSRLAIVASLPAYQHMVKTRSGAVYERQEGQVVEVLNRLFGALNVSKSKSQYCHVVGSDKHHHPSRWIKYWESQAGEKRGDCSFDGCNAKAVLGAHIYKAYEKPDDCTWYVVPSCSECNAAWKHKEFASPVAAGGGVLACLGPPPREAGPKSYMKPNTFKAEVAKYHNGVVTPVAGKWVGGTASAA